MLTFLIETATAITAVVIFTAAVIVPAMMAFEERRKRRSGKGVQARRNSR